MWFEQLQFETKRLESEKVSWWEKAGTYEVVWNKWRKQDHEEMNSETYKKKDL